MHEITYLQETQLSQRDRETLGVVESFTKLLKSQGRAKWHRWVGGMCKFVLVGLNSNRL